ncbi:hypothetical protein HZA55_05805 [Candidatus Poribacteria bacterium]|nr:hypothetical protein [Candidatus Poribacteria bacterium]
MTAKKWRGVKRLMYSRKIMNKTNELNLKAGETYNSNITLPEQIKTGTNYLKLEIYDASIDQRMMIDEGRRTTGEQAIWQKIFVDKGKVK